MSEKVELLELDVNAVHCCSALSRVISRYNTYFKREIDPYYDKNKRRKINKKHYPFIPSGSNAGLAIILLALMAKFRTEFLPPYKFLDCGCGIGNVVMLAHTIGYNADGIEYDGKTHRIAEKLTRAKLTSDMRIIRGDITTFRSYKNYDVIFYYVPISNTAKMGLFVSRLKEKAKVGAYIIPYSSGILTTSRSRIKKVKLKWSEEMYQASNFNLHSIHLYKKVRG